MSLSALEVPTETVVQQPPAPAEKLFQMSVGYMISSALHIATKLDIADLLWEGPRSVDALAQKSAVSADALYRVLRALASVGVFAETAPRYFELTPDAAALARKSESSARDLIHWVTDPVHLPIYAELMHSVKTGKPALDFVHGKPAFEVLFDMPEVAQSFNNGMTAISAVTGPAIIEGYDFSGIYKLVDVGGGHGFLLRSILDKYPALTGVLYDLPKVIEGATQKFNDSELSSRLEFIGGDMFESVPEGADAYFMQHIIHDWDDEHARIILRNCRKALASRPNGKVLLAEGVVPVGNEPSFKKVLDLEMLAMCGGKERSEQEYRDLLASAGFRLNRVVKTKAMVDIIEGVCA